MKKLYESPSVTLNRVITEGFIAASQPTANPYNQVEAQLNDLTKDSNYFGDTKFPTSF